MAGIVHLIKRRYPAFFAALGIEQKRFRAACGVDTDSGTRDPSAVTCKGCVRSVFMADAEIIWRRQQRRR